MMVGVLELRLRLPNVHSLKEKRSILKSLIARLRQKFNISVAEVDEQNKWQIAVVAVACVSGDSALAHRQLEMVLHFVDTEQDVIVLESSVEIL